MPKFETVTETHGLSIYSALTLLWKWWLYPFVAIVNNVKATHKWNQWLKFQTNHFSDFKQSHYKVYHFQLYENSNCKFFTFCRISFFPPTSLFIANKWSECLETINFFGTRKNLFSYEIFFWQFQTLSQTNNTGIKPVPGIRIVIT